MDWVEFCLRMIGVIAMVTLIGMVGALAGLTHPDVDRL